MASDTLSLNLKPLFELGDITCFIDVHKNYNFFDCDWLKELQFSTNSLLTLL